jgi:hypothetical protein
MAYVIIFGNLIAAVVISFLLARLIWCIPLARRLHQIAIYNEMITKSSYDRIDKRPPLADFANLDDAYLFEAMKVLVECEPSRAAEVVVTLEPRLSRLRRDMLGLGGDAWGAFCEAAEDWAQHIMTVAPVSWLTDLWQRADHKRDQVWLFELIFGNEAKPVSLHEDESPDGIFIECERRKLLLRVSDKEYNTMRHIRSILATKEFHRWVQNPDDIVYSIPVPSIYVSLAAEEVVGRTRCASDVDIQESKTIGAFLIYLQPG